MIKFSPNQPPYLTVYAPPAWNNPDATQLDFMQYSIPNKGVLPVGTMMQFPTGSQPSDWLLVTADTATTDNQWVIPQSMTWTTGTLPFSDGVNDAVWTGTAFVVVGKGGKIATSSDGVTWVNRTSGTTNSITCIAYNATTGKLAALAGTVVLSSSDNGVTWVNLGNPNASISALDSIDVMESGFIILGRNLYVNNAGYIVYQSNINAFTTLKIVPNSGDFCGQKSIIYAGNNIIFFGFPSNNKIYSFDATTLILSDINSDFVAKYSSYFNFFKIGKSIFVKTRLYQDDYNISFATIKALKSIITPICLPDKANYQYINVYKKHLIAVARDGWDTFFLLHFYRGTAFKSVSYRGNLNPNDSGINNNFNNVRVVSNNTIILTFLNLVGFFTYSIGTPSANYVTSVPHEPDDGYSWYIKTFI